MMSVPGVAQPIPAAPAWNANWTDQGIAGVAPVLTRCPAVSLAVDQAPAAHAIRPGAAQTLVVGVAPQIGEDHERSEEKGQNAGTPHAGEG